MKGKILSDRTIYKGKVEIEGKGDAPYWNFGPTEYEHIPFGLRIARYGAVPILEKQFDWSAIARFFKVERMGEPDSYYGPVGECANYMGTNPATVKRKAKNGGLYRGKYSVCEIDFERFLKETGRRFRVERHFADRY